MLTIRSVRLSTLGVALLAPAVAAAPGDVTVNGAVASVAGFGWNLKQLTPVDLDGDGLLDLVGSGGNGASLWRQLEDGTLTPLPGADISGMAVVVDLDGDGLLSLVGASNGLGILAQEFGAPFVLGPTSQLAAPPDSGGSTMALEGDFDGDGDADILASANPPDVGLRSWLGDGTGGLLPSILASSVLTVRTELGDLDLDGTLDVLAGLEGFITPLLGQGDGTFVAQAPIAVIIDVRDVALGHLDGDGLLDAAIASSAGPQLLLGTGGGGLQAWTSAPGFVNSADLGDADADGDDDLVTYSNSTDSVTVHLVGPSGLGASSSFVVQQFVQDVRLAPLRPSGPATILASRLTTGFADVAVVECGPDGLPALEQQFASAPSAIPLALADVDGDGRDELVALQLLAPLTEQVVVHEIPGDGTIGPASAGTPINPGADVRPVFLDGDAFEDLLVTSNSAAVQANVWEPWLSNGDGTFTPGAIIHQQAQGAWTDTVGDVDGDGDDDLLTAGSSAGVTWVASLGDGTFAPGVAVLLPGVPTPRSVVLADADEDGLVDLFAETGFEPAVITWWKGAGDGSFGPAQVLATGPQEIAPLHVVDVDGDGHADVLSHGYALLDGVFGSLLTVVHGHGDGSFDAPRIYPAGFLATGQPPAAIDFDHDGRLDVIVQDAETQRELLLAQAADGSFGEERPLAFEIIGAPLTADVDGDGDEDFLSYLPTFSSNPKPLRVGWVDVQAGALDLGHALIGSAGTPLLTGGGLLQPTQAVLIGLAGAPPATPLLLVLGLETGYEPLAGGTLVPRPDVVLGGIFSAPDGSFHLQARWPADAPAGLAVYVQAWCQDPLTGAAVASNALQFEGD